MFALTPPPAEIGELLVRMTRLEWPTSEDQRLAYFAALDLQDVDEPSRSVEYPESTMLRFATSIPGVDGNCSMFRDEFLGLSLFGYNERAANSAAARVGYAALQEHLCDHLGPPVEEWGSESEPACLWRPGPLLLDLYYFQRPSSGIMVGPSHAERSAANDAAAAERPS